MRSTYGRITYRRTVRTLSEKNGWRIIHVRSHVDVQVCEARSTSSAVSATSSSTTTTYLNSWTWPVTRTRSRSSTTVTGRRWSDVTTSASAAFSSPTTPRSHALNTRRPTRLTFRWPWELSSPTVFSRIPRRRRLPSEVLYRYANSIT